MAQKRNTIREAAPLLGACLLVSLLLSALDGAPGSGQERVRDLFRREVRPILARNCFLCHNTEKPKRGLDLTRLDTLFRGGKSGRPLEPGKSRESLMVRVLRPDNRPHMPPKKELDPAEVQAIARWIDAMPGGFQLDPAGEKEELQWAFRKLRRPELPPVKESGWARTPIDRFILQKLEESGLAPGPAAPRGDLIRRASLDLIGLPPTPGEVDAFILDDSPAAFEKVVDRLLASPAYGERWARHWLDLARYAESEGFKSDETRPHAWRYRDYVIRSLNQDKPYDRFVKEQIAGDELWPDDPDARLATAFNRHYPDESNARNLLQRRQEILNDITDTVGSAFLGLTFGCARCHDHKYDPILQKDYYRLQAFFANVRAADDLVLATTEKLASHRRRMEVWEEKTRDIRSEMAVLEEKKRREMAKDNFDKFPHEIQAAIERAESERSPIERLMFWKAKPYLYPDRKTIAASLQGPDKKRWQELKAELDRFKELYPGDLPVGSAIADAGRKPPPTFVLASGVYDRPTEEVEPGFLSALDPSPASIEPPGGLDSSGRRAALARWLADPENPLAMRVIVNRVWHHHFGRGIAATPNDLGAMGDAPSHPELLDWLAGEFARSGFSLKRLHRLIMTSSVYQEASGHRPEAARLDPENRLLWRFPRSRLEAEVIRDACLAVSGLLNRKEGGPSVFPPLPRGMESYGKWAASPDPGERNRRSIYVFVRRNSRYPLFEAFDMPDTHESCGRRYVTITAPQALMMLNGELTLEWAQGFAARVLELAGPSREAQIGAAYRIAYSRSPARSEREMAFAFLERQRAIVAERAAAGEELALPGGPLPPQLDRVEAAVLVDFCHMLINSNEFIYKS
jgi:hypothetical protein